jgi:hypothetical protein
MQTFFSDASGAFGQPARQRIDANRCEVRGSIEPCRAVTLVQVFEDFMHHGRSPSHPSDSLHP